MQFDRLKRREFITLVGGAAVAGRWRPVRSNWADRNGSVYWHLSPTTMILRVGLIINAHVFRPLRDAEKARECWQGGPTPRRSRLFSRNPWRAVGIG